MNARKRVLVVITFALALGLTGVISKSQATDAVTTHPLKVLTGQALHRLFPIHEEDEAFFAQRTHLMNSYGFKQIMKGADEDYFADMDYGATKDKEALRKTVDAYVPGITADEAVRRVARGRDNWLVWSGGNDQFWNYMTQATFGSLDFLKTISDNPVLPATRDNRWKELGLVNEPCFEKATGPRKDRFGLWLPTRSTNCGPDPFESEAKYPGVKVGARGINMETGSFYGMATGVVGLRLFTNPDFDEEAQKKWDPVRFYNDPSYYTDPKLVRPYRVGMACAFCHVGPNPSNPPADFAKPEWKNLNSNPGAQYFWVDRIFVWDYKRSQDSFIYQLLHTSRPGALDTSVVSSDQINNPRSMNAVYDFPARVAIAQKFGHREYLTGDETLNKEFSNFDSITVPNSSPLRGLFDEKTQSVLSPRVLKDGSDSVGALGALNRVYVNIGLFGDEWVQNFIPLVGGSHVTPFSIKAAQKKSLYWAATENQTPDVGLFFLATSKPDKLEAAPGGAQFLKPIDGDIVNRGKKVFAQTCARCHSSKLPEQAYQFFSKNPAACAGQGYLECWDKYWAYTKTPEFKQKMESIVMESDFLKDNFLSTDLRVPANLLDSQLCSPLATNALEGDIWDNFSSTSYKALPSIGKFKVAYPEGTSSTLKSMDVDVPGGGRGFLRPASLISLWSTAPFLGNNSLGKFDWRGTVEGRMSSFDDSINLLLNPELRGRDDGHGGKKVVTYTTNNGDTLKGIMDVTSVDTYLNIPKGYLPRGILRTLQLVQGADRLFNKLRYGSKGSNRTYASLGGVGNRVPASEAENSSAASYTDAEMKEFVKIGPIPAGVPINLIANIALQTNDIRNPIAWAAFKFRLAEAITSLASAVIQINKQGLKGDAALQFFMNKAGSKLVAASKCADFVVDRGHYFGTQYSPEVKDGTAQALSQDDKAALIEFLKHM